jgi:FkbM family methyltransferase
MDSSHIETMKYTVIRINDRAKSYVERNKQILSKLECVDDIQFFDGLRNDGRTALINMGVDLETWNPYDYREWKALPAEYGIWVSVINILQYIVDCNISELLVFEDDISIDKNFIVNFQLCLNELPENYDYFSLFYLDSQNFVDDKSEIGCEYIHSSVNQPASMCGTLYSNSGAKRILEQMRLRGMEYTVDCFIHHLSSVGLVNGYSIKPNTVTLLALADENVKSVIDPLNRRLNAKGEPQEEISVYDGEHSAEKLSSFFYAVQRILKPSVSVEVGANSAEFSKQIISTCEGIRRWAFEANPYVYTTFSHDVSSHNVQYLNLAVSDDCKDINFNIRVSHNDELLQPTMGNNSIHKRNEENSQYLEVVVKSVSLDSFFVDKKVLKPEDRVCLWVDVEGASKEVLTGAIKLLGFVDSIMIEVEHREHWLDQWLFSDVNKFLNDNGFIALVRDTEYEEIGQNNVVYVRKNLDSLELLVSMAQTVMVR